MSNVVVAGGQIVQTLDTQICHNSFAYNIAPLSLNRVVVEFFRKDSIQNRMMLFGESRHWRQ